MARLKCPVLPSGRPQSTGRNAGNAAALASAKPATWLFPVHEATFFDSRFGATAPFRGLKTTANAREPAFIALATDQVNPAVGLFPVYEATFFDSRFGASSSRGLKTTAMTREPIVVAQKTAEQAQRSMFADSELGHTVFAIRPLRRGSDGWSSRGVHTTPPTRDPMPTAVTKPVTSSARWTQSKTSFAGEHGHTVASSRPASSLPAGDRFPAYDAEFPDSRFESFPVHEAGFADSRFSR